MDKEGFPSQQHTFQSNATVGWSVGMIKPHYPLVAKLLLAKHIGEVYL